MAKANKAATNLREIIRVLTETADKTHAPGIRFTINRDGRRKGTIGIRISHTEDYEQIVSRAKSILYLQKSNPLLEQITINKSFKSDPISHRKVLYPELRTVYVILRPPLSVFNHVSETLDTVKGYGAIDLLSKVLSEM